MNNTSERYNVSNDKNVKVGINEQAKRKGRIYKSSGNLFICKQVCRTVPHNFTDCSRNPIVAFTAGAGRRMRAYLRECLSEYSQMVTLTYPGFYPTDGRAVKEHLRRFLQELRRVCVRWDLCEESNHSAFWFLEFQNRGAPHFHIFTNACPDKDWVARRWYEIVNSADERHLRAGTRVEFLRSGRSGTISYASKYAAKQEQKAVPEGFENVGRFWGVAGRRSVMSAATFVDSRQGAEARVKAVEQSIAKEITKLVWQGEMEVFVRKDGIFVGQFWTVQVAKKMRSLIARLSATTMHYPNNFCDADIDQGVENELID